MTQNNFGQGDSLGFQPNGPFEMGKTEYNEEPVPAFQA
jgi:hypothetical protein